MLGVWVVWYEIRGIDVLPVNMGKRVNPLERRLICVFCVCVVAKVIKPACIWLRGGSLIQQHNEPADCESSPVCGVQETCGSLTCGREMEKLFCSPLFLLRKCERDNTTKLYFRGGNVAVLFTPIVSSFGSFAGVVCSHHTLTFMGSNACVLVVDEERCRKKRSKRQSHFSRVLTIGHLTSCAWGFFSNFKQEKTL